MTSFLKPVITVIDLEHIIHAEDYTLSETARKNMDNMRTWLQRKFFGCMELVYKMHHCKRGNQDSIAISKMAGEHFRAVASTLGCARTRSTNEALTKNREGSFWGSSDSRDLQRSWASRRFQRLKKSRSFQIE